MGVDLMRLRRKILLNTPHFETASGSIVTFNTDLSARLKALSLQISPIQSGSGDPSPDNIRPITGWTEASIWNDPKFAGNIVWNQWADSGLSLFNKNRCSVATSENVTTVTVTTSSSLKSTRLEFPADHKLFVGMKKWLFTRVASTTGAPYIGIYNGATATGYSLRIYPTNDSAYYNIINVGHQYTSNRFTIGFATTNAIGDKVDITDLQVIDLTQMFGSTVANYIYSLEQGSSGAGVAYFKSLFPRDYYSFSEGALTCVSAVNGGIHEHVITDFGDAGGVVYSGTLDVLAGLLTIDKIAADLGELSFSTRYTGGTKKTISSSLPISYKRRDAEQSPFFAEKYTAITAVAGVATLSSPDSYDIGIYWYNNSGSPTPKTFYMVIDKTDAPSGLLVYELATPVTYHLTPQQIQTLKGTNNIWADSGPVSAKYLTH